MSAHSAPDSTGSVRPGLDSPVNPGPAASSSKDAGPEREVLTWSTFGDAIRTLAASVHASGYQPDVVLGLARGGLVPAGAIAYALDIRNVFTMAIEFYTGVNTRHDVPAMLPPFLDPAELDDLSVLVVDDVADTGRTLELVRDYCAGHVRQSRTAVLYEKPRSVVHADYVWAHTDRWINFPWSTQPPVTQP